MDDFRKFPNGVDQDSASTRELVPLAQLNSLARPEKKNPATNESSIFLLPSPRLTFTSGEGLSGAIRIPNNHCFFLPLGFTVTSAPLVRVQFSYCPCEADEFLRHEVGLALPVDVAKCDVCNRDI